jgi:hypothetical protein
LEENSPLELPDLNENTSGFPGEINDLQGTGAEKSEIARRLSEES